MYAEFIQDLLGFVKGTWQINTEDEEDFFEVLVNVNSKSEYVSILGRHIGEER